MGRDGSLGLCVTRTLNLAGSLQGELWLLGDVCLGTGATAGHLLLLGTIAVCLRKLGLTDFHNDRMTPRVTQFGSQAGRHLT